MIGLHIQINLNYEQLISANTDFELFFSFIVRRLTNSVSGINPTHELFDSNT